MLTCVPVTAFIEYFIQYARHSCEPPNLVKFRLLNEAQRHREMFKTKKDLAVAPPAQGPYTSGDVARIAGVSLRQLQWWDERNVVSPRQEGHRRVYLSQEVVEVSVIAELRRKGFSLQKIRRVLRFLQKEMGKRLSDAVANDGDVHLITDGKNIYLKNHPDRIIDVLKNAK